MLPAGAVEMRPRYHEGSGLAGLISSFSIGNIDINLRGCNAVGMTAHDATRRRYIDQLRIARALCP